MGLKILNEVFERPSRPQEVLFSRDLTTVVTSILEKLELIDGGKREKWRKKVLYTVSMGENVEEEGFEGNL